MEHLDANGLAALQDQSLDAATGALALEHLASCAECRSRLGAQVRAGREAPRERQGAGAASAMRFPRVPRAAPWLLAAAVAGLAVLYGVWRDGVEDREPRLAGAPREVAGPAAPRAEVPTADPRLPPGGAARPPPSVAPRPAQPAAPPAPATLEPLATPPAADPPVDATLLALRGSTRRVEGKAFRLREGVWVDDAYASGPPREPTELVRGTPAYGAALRRHRLLSRYAEVGPRVLVVVDGAVLRIVPGVGGT